MLVDDITITITAGHGGAGKVSFGRQMHSGPDGGNGGKGGDVYISVTSDLYALNQFSTKKHIQAERGQPGDRNRKSGRGGETIELKLPIGSVVTDLKTGEELELIDLEQRILICKGGLGGKGNYEFRSPENTTPRYAQPGLPGETIQVRILLKFLASYGLIGLPNAGKSSLLNELTNAKAKIGNYPFTTLETNLGEMDGKIIADIPGLIEGAAEGKGLGIKFLKHIEKVTLLLHCISSESDHVSEDYEVITNELGKFSPKLLEKNRIILLTKTDIVPEEKVLKQAKELKKFKYEILPISLYDEESIEKLRKKLG